MSQVTMSKLEGEVVAYFSDPAARVDPYPFYRRLRESAPVYYSPTLDLWLVTSFAGVTEAMRKDQAHDPANYLNNRLASDMSPTLKLMYNSFFLFTDPPDHTKYRNLFKRSMAGDRAEGLRKSMVGWFADIQSKYKDAEAFEFVHAIAHPSPFKVMCELLDVRFEDYPKIQSWIMGFIGMTEPDVRPEAEAFGESCFAQFREYLQPVISARIEGHVRKQDILQDLVDAYAESIITLDQVVMMVYTFIIGGHETTGSAIGNGVLALFENREQWNALVADPTLTGKAVEEILRYESPSRHLHFKSMREDIEILGTTIPKGNRVIPWFGAAHRDPDRYKDPNTFDITRADGGSMVFGFGRHFCIGAAFARVELQVFFSNFPQRFPNAEQLGPVEWDPGLMLRGLANFPMRLNA